MMIPRLIPETLFFVSLLKLRKMRYHKLLARSWLPKYLLLSMLLWIHMKEIIHALLLSQHHIYMLEELGLRLENSLSMILTMRTKIGLKNSTEKERFLWLKRKILNHASVRDIYTHPHTQLSLKQLFSVSSLWLETILFKLEVLDHKARERAGVIVNTLGSPVPVILSFDAAVEALQSLSIKYGVFQSIYNYWKDKRERWQKPSLRRLQPPPPVNDTNPYNVFRPREKAHRLHTRRMQRRENNTQSFEKLRQVRRNLDQAKIILEALIKREEKKREVIESEISLQRLQMKHKNETELLEDTLTLPEFPSFPSKVGSSEDEFADSDDPSIGRPHDRHVTQHITFPDTKLVTASPRIMRREFKRRHVLHGWLHKLDPNEPPLLFTKPLDPAKLSAAGIIPPGSPTPNGLAARTFSFRGRMGRGGRIVFDRWNPLSHAPIECGNTLYVPPKARHSAHQ